MNQDEIDKAMAERWERNEGARESAEQQAARLNDERAKVEMFTPAALVPWHFTFLIEVKPCVHCDKPTVADLQKGPFPSYWRSNFTAQRERAGIKLLHHWHDNNFPVCVGCKDAGKHDFDCSHCKQTRPLSESHASYGMPAEHLCVHCYATVPAKQWEGLVAELEEQHRYDFE